MVGSFPGCLVAPGLPVVAAGQGLATVISESTVFGWLS